VKNGEHGLDDSAGSGDADHPSVAPAATRLRTPAFIALFGAAFAFFISGGMVLPVASRFADGPLGADSLGVGIAIGAFAVAALAMRPVVGWASDRFGRRPLLVGGGLLTVVALALHVVVASLPTFIAVRCLLGVGEAFFFVAALAAVSDLAPEERRGEAMNLGSLSVYLGLAVGPLIGETILSAAGFDPVWIVAAMMATLATVLTLLVPETAPTIVAPKAGPRARARLVHPAGLLPGFLILTGAWGMAGYFAFLPLYATEVGLDGTGSAFAVYALVVVGLRIAFAKLPDQVGPARLSGAALAVGGTGLAILALGDGPIGLLAGTVVFATGVAFMFPALMSVAVSRVDEAERGSVVGTTSAFLDLAFGLAPAVLGIVVGASGFGVAFGLSAAIALGGSALLFVRRDSMTRPVSAHRTVPAQRQQSQ
jgi:MFS family permease